MSHSSLPDKQLDNVDQQHDTMRFPTLIAGLMAIMATNVAATALTYKLSANEKACFYATTKNENEKVAFYFAVSWRQSRCVAIAALSSMQTMFDANILTVVGDIGSIGWFV